MAKAKILVVEDEIVVAKAIQLALQRHGYDAAATASAGLEAIQKTDEMKPDLILMDIVLKGSMDGITAVEQIRSRFDIPIVYLTAYTNSETVQRAKITEPFGYITKPFDERELHTNIEMALYKHKMDKVLRKSESEKQLILSTLSELIIYLDKNLRVVRANKAAGDSVGQPADELVGRYCYEVWHGRREPCPGCPMAKSIETGEPQEGEITTPDGRIWFIRANPVRDEKGEVTGVVETTLDITQRKRAEEQLRFMQFAVEHIADPAFWIGPDAQFTYVNEAACRSLGYTREELLSMTVHDIDPDFGPEVWPDHWKEIKKRGSFTIESHHRTKDGRVFPVEIGVNFLAYGDNEYNCAFTRDITERKKAEEALRKSEERFRQVVENAEEWIWETDANGLYTYASPIVEKILGFKPEDIVCKKHFYDLFVPEDKKELQKAAFEAFAKKQTFNKFTNRNVHKNGEIVWLSTSGVPILDEKVNLLGYRGADIDITERKKAEQKLIDYQVQLRSLALESLRIEEAERRRLARGLHDNIGQELVLAKMELQSSMQSTMGPDAMAMLDKVCKLLDKVMQDVHSLTFELSSPVLCEVGLVAAVEQWLDEEIRKKHGIRYKLAANVKSKAFDHELSATVFRVVRELLINVIKHAKAKNIRVGIKELKGALSIAIEDDGVGFDVAKFAKALRKGKKTKFGLFSAKEQLEFLGGKFRIESVPKKGKKVSMTVPLRTEDRRQRSEDR